jgi:hypothetical protein
MSDKRNTVLGADGSDAAKGSAARGTDEHYQNLRRLGGLAYQVRAVTRAADHFVAQEAASDHDTASWLVSVSLELGLEVAAELDGLAKNLKERPPETGLMHPLQKVRMVAHQFHAAARAADHFLDQDSGEDHGTGSWLIACAMGLADKLANELDDLASQIKRPGGEAAFAEATSPKRAAGGIPNVGIKGVVV